MKLTIVLMIATLLQVNAAGYAQKVSLVKKNTTLEQVFEEIRRQTGYNFLYDVEMLEGIKPIDVQFKETPLKEVLQNCFKSLLLTYTIKKNTIVVQRKTVLPVLQSRPVSLKKEVRGTVRDSTGTLPGVSVTVKGRPGVGTTTDINGKYFLDVPDDKSILVFSMVGFEKLEVAVNGKDVINVTLQDTQSSLEEVVVVAFGTQKKADVIGAVTTINPIELKVPSSNLTTALAGRLSGVIAFQRSGEPGDDDAEFFIRGIATFGYNNKPLILIDGIELPSAEFSRLQPDDIASFSILKDATATALYGARGANGVVLVTTKEGKNGKAKVSFRVENTMSTPTSNVQLADPITYMRLNNEAVLTRDPNQTLPLPYSQEQIESTIAGKNPYVYPTVDWRKELFKKSTLNQRANFNISGGGDLATYYVAGTLNKDNGILKVDGQNNFNNNINLKSYSLRSNIGLNITKSTHVEVRLYGSFDDYTGPIDGGSGTYRNVMRAVPSKFPAQFPDNPLVNHIQFGNFLQGASYYLNPYANMVKGYKEYSKSLMFAQFEVKQDLSALTQGLSFKATAHTNREAYFDAARSYSPFWHQVSQYDKLTDNYSFATLNENPGSPQPGTEYLEFKPRNKNLKLTMYGQMDLSYNREFSKHGLSGLLIGTWRNHQESLFDPLDATPQTLQQSLPYRNSGLAGRFTYSYNSRYFAEFNFGYNGSERFASKERFGFFPSAGLAWYASNEEFMKPLSSVISKLKFRGTYGLVGNDAIGSSATRFFYLSEVNLNDASRSAWFGTESSYSRSGILVSRYENPRITWEVARKINLGVELGLFNKVDIQLDFFKESRDKILMTRTDLPTTLGLTATVMANSGKATAQGMDMSLVYSHHFNNRFWLNTRGNFTYSTSKYVTLDEPDFAASNSANRSQVGYNLSQRFGYIAERLFVDDNEVANSPRQAFGTGAQGGDIKYRDVNNDGQITDLDRVPIGYPTVPEIIYGFGFSTGFKAFDLSAFAQGSARSSFWINEGGSTAPFIRYQYGGEVVPANTILQNQLLKAYADDRWTESNRNVYALWPRLSTTNNANNNQQSTWFMRNGNFLRLKSVELGYTLPKNLTTKVRVGNLRVYANGTNLMRFSGFKLWDAEQSSRGLDYPLQKVYNFGIQLTL